MRKKPDGPPPAFIEQTTVHNGQQVTTLERTYKLITPLFGGGAVPQEADEVTVIRGTEIRGQLRFWWRACRSGQFASIEELKKAEDQIWGKAHKKGDPTPDGLHVQIAVEVEEQGKGKYVDAFRTSNDSRDIIPGYAAFPLRESQKGVRKDVTFKLNIRFVCPSSTDKQTSLYSRKDIDAALWAWETFGGLGGRTRRGFGALRCFEARENEAQIEPNLPPNDNDSIRDWLQQSCKTYVVEGSWLEQLTHLMRSPEKGKHFELINAGSLDPFTVWNNLLNTLSHFRQMRTDPLNRRSPGRSCWPEPDAIRHLLGQSISKHKIPIHDWVGDTFPRAVFGLPLPFKFKDDNPNKYNKDDRNSDPRKSILQPAHYNRLSSPLILKPLACQNDTFVGLAFLLKSIDMKKIDIELRPQEGNIGAEYIKKARISLRSDEQFTLHDPRTGFQKDIDHTTDILQVFLEYIAAKFQHERRGNQR